MNLLEPSCKFVEMCVLVDDLDVSESTGHPADEVHDHGIDFILLLEALINRVEFNIRPRSEGSIDELTS